MRDELLNPVSRSKLLKETAKQTDRLYRLHEAGKDYTAELKQLSALVGKVVSKFDLDSAFGTCDSKSFAEDLLVNHCRYPIDLSEDEMLELIECMCNGEGTDTQVNYWVNVMTHITGDDRFSDIVYWPDEYFGDGNVKREMTAREILDTALAAGRKAGKCADSEGHTAKSKSQKRK